MLCAASPAAHAAEPLRLKLATAIAEPAWAREPLFVEISVNGRARGEFTLFRDAVGEYYLPAVALAALGVAEGAGPPPTVQIGNEPFVALRSLRPRRLALDEARLVLELEFAAPALQKSTYDLLPGRPGVPQGALAPGAFLNYRLSASDGSGAEPRKFGLANELALRVGDTLLRNESALVHDAGGTHTVRYATQIVHDRPAERQRLIIGDQVAASGELGSALPIGGVGLFKHYQLTPYFVRQPLAGYAGAASTPSQVEVRMGGVPVFREQVPAGPFELKNLQQFAGARDVEIAVRDALGREQLIDFPFYFADRALRADLHEYSYSLGALREDAGVRSGRYGAALLSAAHRFGLSDRLTLGWRGEAAPGLRNLGPTVLYRDDRLGAFSVGLSASRRDGQAGRASSFSHVYQTPRFGLRSSVRRFSAEYALAQDLLAPPSGLKAEYGLGGSLALGGLGSLFLDRSITRRHARAAARDSAATRLGYTYGLGRQGSIFVTLARVHEERTDTQAFVGVLLSLDGTKTLHLSARRQGDGETYGAQLASAVPPGEGLGYRFGYDGIGGSAPRESHAYLQYNARAASVTLEGAATRHSGAGGERYEAALAGAVVWADGAFGLARHVEDSFIAVQLAAPLAGVRVYSNNQEVGRTDPDGRLIVPSVASFHETQIAIDEADVPLEYSIGATRRVVAPPYRSGTLLRFDVRRLRAVQGVLLRRSRDGVRPAANALVRIGGREFVTGPDGRYYIEDLPPGEHAALLGECAFRIGVPDSAEPVASLPEATACE